MTANTTHGAALAKIIYRHRGDRSPDVIYEKVKETGLPRNVTGFTYTLTINTLKDPPDDTTQVVQIPGVIIDAVNGHVQFPWDSSQANQAIGEYWYDIQRVDGSGLPMTIAKNKYIFRQDITK